MERPGTMRRRPPASGRRPEARPTRSRSGWETLTMPPLIMPPLTESPTGTVPAAVRRRLAPPGPAGRGFWFAALLVTAIGAGLRLIGLGHPRELMFDEVYYANDAWDLLQRGVEWR